MEKEKKYLVIFIGIVLLLIPVIIFLKNTKPNSDKQMNQEYSNNVIPEQSVGNLEEIKVTGYHLVTYAQSSNTNSFIKSMTVNTSNDGKVRFVIGRIDSESIVKERLAFEIDCKKGENTIDLLDERYLVKQGEYLFMDISGQDVLYIQEGVSTKSLVQTETNKISGKMIMTESNYILPFKYSLEKVQEYHALTIGNNITTQNGGTGLNATDNTHDYYYLTKSRLENTFEKLNMNRINAIDWEKSIGIESKKIWMETNLKKDSITDLDLVIFQLGDNYNKNDDFEVGVTEMVSYIRKYSPNAEMIWIGLWNIDEERLNRLPGICERLGIEFINISDLVGADYQSIVKEPIENTATNTISYIENSYPNNEAMQIISNRIIENLKFDF